MSKTLGEALTVKFPLARAISSVDGKSLIYGSIRPAAVAFFFNRYNLHPQDISGFPGDQLQGAKSSVYWLPALLGSPKFLTDYPEFTGVVLPAQIQNGTLPSEWEQSDLELAYSPSLGGAYLVLRNYADALGLIVNPGIVPPTPGRPDDGGISTVSVSRPVPVGTPPSGSGFVSSMEPLAASPVPSAPAASVAAPVSPVSSLVPVLAPVAPFASDPGLTPAVRANLAVLLKTAYPSKSVEIDAANSLLGNGSPTPAKLLNALLPSLLGNDPKAAAWVGLVEAVLALAS